MYQFCNKCCWYLIFFIWNKTNCFNAHSLVFISSVHWTEDAVWRNRFPLNNINACWFLLLVQCAQTVLNIQTMYGLDSDYLNCFSNLRQDNGKSLMKTLRLHVIMVEPSHYMFNHNKYVSRMNAIAAKQCLWPHCVTKMTETGSLLSQSLRFKACKTYTTAN